MPNIPTAKLNTGAIIPLIGLGTWQSKSNEVYDAVRVALDAGYRHIDTAFIYGNEKEVGQAIKDSGVPREELFITTKLWNTSHDPKDVAPALDVSLKNLQMDYIDLPVGFQSGGENMPRDANGKIQVSKPTYLETWGAMEQLSKTKTRAIGVSNFNISTLKNVLDHGKIPPAVNQVEMHPYLAQDDLLKFANDHVTAYSPLGSTDSPLMKDDKLAIAKKYGKSAAQIVLSWNIKRGVSVIPKSVTKSRIIENFQIVPDLDPADCRALSQLIDGKERRIVDPKTFWDIDIFNFK